MAEIITMPRLSDTMEEGTVANWLKKVGDAVKEGDILAEIETDKATMEFESFYEGTLLHIGLAEGETAYVDALLAIIGDAGEDISGMIGSVAPATVQTSNTPATVTQDNIPDNPGSTTINAGTALPAGVQVITMPRLSDTMEEGTVASWLKKEGDTVAEGDIGRNRNGQSHNGIRVLLYGDLVKNWNSRRRYGTSRCIIGGHWAEGNRRFWNYR